MSGEKTNMKEDKEMHSSTNEVYLQQEAGDMASPSSLQEFARLEEQAMADYDNKIIEQFDEETINEYINLLQIGEQDQTIQANTESTESDKEVCPESAHTPKTISKSDPQFKLPADPRNLKRKSMPNPVSSWMETCSDISLTPGASNVEMVGVENQKWVMAQRQKTRDKRKSVDSIDELGYNYAVFSPNESSQQMDEGLCLKQGEMEKSKMAAENLGEAFDLIDHAEKETATVSVTDQDEDCEKSCCSCSNDNEEIDNGQHTDDLSQARDAGGLLQMKEGEMEKSKMAAENLGEVFDLIEHAGQETATASVTDQDEDCEKSCCACSKVCKIN